MSMATRAYKESLRRMREERKTHTRLNDRVRWVAERIANQEELELLLAGVTSLKRQLMIEKLRPHLPFTPAE